MDFAIKQLSNEIHQLAGSEIQPDHLKSLFSNLQAKVKIFILHESKKSIKDLEEQKRVFNVSLSQLDNQKKAEKR